jgi:hypothetical protein
MCGMMLGHELVGESYRVLLGPLALAQVSVLIVFCADL